MNKLDLEIGLKFQKFYNKDNINNIQNCEVRGIIDDEVIVLYCKKDKSSMSDYKEFYKMIYIDDFNFNVENKIFIEL